MSNPDILGKADKALRPVLKELHRFSWMRIEGCCAGHKPEDTLWFEISVLGSSGLSRQMELLRILDAKLLGTDIRIDCLLSYGAASAPGIPAHGWIPTSLEVFWPAKPEWRRSQSMVVETLLSSIEEFASRLTEPYKPEGAINYCPFCSSSFVRIEAVATAGGRYRCGDCDMTWTMNDPTV